MFDISSRLFLWTVLAAVLISGISSSLVEPGKPSEETLIPLLPQAATVEFKTDPIRHYQGSRASGSPAGSIVLTEDNGPTAKGYMGEIVAAVGIDAAAVIRGVALTRHAETPYYLEMVLASGLLENMEGIDLSKPFPEIDTISGATVSSAAIINNVQNTALISAFPLFRIKPPPPTAENRNPWLNWRVFLLAGALLMSLTVLFFEVRWLKKSVLIVNLLVIGILVNSPLTLSASGRILSFNLPGGGNPYLILILVYVVISLPFFGRSYCRWVCPFGALQYFLNKWSPWQLRPSQAVATVLPAVRRFFLGSLMLGGLILGWGGLTETEPFYALFSLKISSLSWIFIMVILFISVPWRRFWCNTLCPTGTLLWVVGSSLKSAKGKTDETV